MPSYLSCVAYENIKCRIHIDDHIYLFMNTAENSLEVTLNPNQAKLLGEALINATGKIAVGSIDNNASMWFGDFETVYEIAEGETENEHNSGKSIGNDTGNHSGNTGAEQGKEIRIA